MTYKALVLFIVQELIRLFWESLCYTALYWKVQYLAEEIRCIRSTKIHGMKSIYC